MTCILLACIPAARAATAYEITPGNAGHWEVMFERGIVARLGLIGWGPGWSWLDIHSAPNGKPAVGKESWGGTLVTDVGGAAVTLAIKARRASAEGVAIDYELSASRDVDLVGIAVALTPETQIFAAGSRIAGIVADGSPKDFAMPMQGPAIRHELRRMELYGKSPAGGRKVRLAMGIEPARLVETEDGTARVWLAKGKIAGGQKVRTTVTLSVPEPVGFYATEADSTTTDITRDWFAYPVGQYGTPVDLSFLNKDASGNFVPAGAHGFAKVKGEQFVFEDGTPARFWGVNVVAYAAIADAQRAVQLAERLARLGVNVVRLHHLDADWAPSLLVRNRPDGKTQELDAANLDKLDRLVFELKKRGIYVIFDPWVGRSFGKGDDVPGWDQMKGNFGLHPYMFFDPHLQDLHERYLKLLWTHVNPYTKLAYKDEPAVLSTEVVNEFLLLEPKLQPYRDNYLKLYREWCEKNGIKPAPGDAIIRENWQRDHQRFFVHVMQTFFRRVYDYDRSLGIRVPINASNWMHWPWFVVAMEPFDFMDAHDYYHGENLGPEYGLGGLCTAHPPTEWGHPWAGISATNVYGKPMTVSECGQSSPAPYRAAYFFGLAAVASLQGWDSVTGFAYSQSPWPTGKLGEFEYESDPVIVAGLAAGALAYRRGDIAEAKQTAVMLLPEAERYSLYWENHAARSYQNTPRWRAAVEEHRLRVVLADEMPKDVRADVVLDADSSFKWRPSSTELKSDTGELWRDWRKRVATVNTPRTQAAYGMIGSGEMANGGNGEPATWKTADCEFAIRTPYAVVVVQSLTDEPIARSKRLLLTAAARAWNAKTRLNLSGTRVAAGGDAPVVAEPVRGTVSVRTSAKSLAVYPIGANGARGERRDVEVKDGVAKLDMGAATLFYEVRAD